MPPSYPAPEPAAKSCPSFKQEQNLVRQILATSSLHVMFEAAQYFNACIYTELHCITELGPNPHVYRITPAILHHASSLPEYLQLSTVCMALGHYMAANLPPGEQYLHHKPRAMVERFYSYRGKAIRSLNEALGTASVTKTHAVTNQFHDVLLIGVLTQLLVDAQHGLPLAWRCHLSGLERLISLRGGLASISRVPALEPLLVSVLFIAVISETTCPSSALATTFLTNTHTDSATIYAYIRQCTAASPFHLCPPHLFAEIANINDIRRRASMTGNTDPSSFQAHVGEPRFGASCTLERILAFDVDHWASSKAAGRSAEGAALQRWRVVGQAFKAATGLYCVLSLPPLQGAPLETPAVDVPAFQPDDRRDVLAARLLSTLAEATHFPCVRRFMLWPLVVLGISAGADSETGSGRCLARDNNEGGVPRTMLGDYGDTSSISTENGNNNISQSSSSSADHATAAVRVFVSAQLVALSRQIGTFSPLIARDVLEAFWQKNTNTFSGGMSAWDSCFDKPYVFTSQIAVDTTGVLPAD
ncbi:fungal-specific transcription factor domain-domain-containing protein [Microdochium bolleyi]|uniref:Fungal-specific transcription factor domain-domain-containing protein n=1 Tax=Microdochium bolleyi TaxID=196109 RepID=A0A136IQ83_9PEZI|nr:fungal-specific transcription factor domain-domain-containing protein [Microdochium bolleyi]